MKLIDRLGHGRKSTWMEPPSWAFDDFRLQWLNESSSWGDREQIDAGFTELVQKAYKRNGIIFALSLARMMVFSQVQIVYQKGLPNGLYGDLYWTSDLEIFRRPSLTKHTSDLLARMIQDADVSGNAFQAKRTRDGRPGLRRLRPDWVTILLATDEGPVENPWELDAEVAGYMYEPGGRYSTEEAFILTPKEVAHFAPIPDPEAQFRGMSWVTPILRELEADGAATAHKLKFFRNGATPQVVVSLDKEVRDLQFKKFVALMESKHKGLANAYATWYLGGGATATVVGKDLRQLDFRNVQGAGETRMAAAAGVPPIIAGFSEGLQSATYSNYGQARRRYADGTVHPLWGTVAGAFSTIVPVPSADRLWYDARDIPFLREDRKDVAAIQSQQAATIRTYTDAGFTPDSAVRAVTGEDLAVLEHTGLFSVQLQPPGTTDSIAVSDPQKITELVGLGWKIVAPPRDRS